MEKIVNRNLSLSRQSFVASLIIAMGALFNTSCLSANRSDHSELAESLAGAIAESGGFFRACDHSRDGCERWAPSFIYIAGASIFSLSQSGVARESLSENGVAIACSGVHDLLHSSFGTERQSVAKEMDLGHVRAEALKLYESLRQESRKRGMSSQKCELAVPDSISGAHGG